MITKAKTMIVSVPFWSKMRMKYPQTMILFGNWVDKYKQENDWGNLFNEGDSDGDSAHYLAAPKFHDLPVAMQMGIFMQFMVEHNPDPEVSDDPMVGAQDFIEDELKWMEVYGGSSR